MSDFKRIFNKETGEAWIETTLKGKNLLNSSLLNKGTTFTEEEREIFNLVGKLPCRVESIAEQMKRIYEQYKRYTTDMSRSIYLNSLHDRNETCFYRLLMNHLEELLPMIYTPTVSMSVKSYSREFRHPRGLYLSYPADKARIKDILKNRTHKDADLIVVTDGSGVLGIGDQGVGGMDIPVAKLMVYTVFAGIYPGRTLPIMLDVGTNNETLLNDPLYLGLRQPRIEGETYNRFIEDFVEAVNESFDHVFLHFEDFERAHAANILKKYYSQICCFNDDIQGTGVVSLSALISGSKAKGQKLSEQIIVIYGAGTAGIGIADQIVFGMVHEGLSEEEARNRIWLIDRQGLLLSQTNSLTSEQAMYAKEITQIGDWNLPNPNLIDLQTVVQELKPTVLIGCSAVSGAFNEKVIKTMQSNCDRPIVMPLSNPTERAEATPEHLLEWTDGKAIIATGSPFEPVNFKGKEITIAQCNNALVFPGIGLGVLASEATRLTDDMLWAATERLTSLSPALQSPEAPVLPSVIVGRDVSHHVALGVAEAAIKSGVSDLPIEKIKERMEHHMWNMDYLPLKSVKSIKD